MGYNYIMLNLNTLKIVKRFFQTLIFDSYKEAEEYANNLEIQIKIIKL